MLKARRAATLINPLNRTVPPNVSHRPGFKSICGCEEKKEKEEEEEKKSSAYCRVIFVASGNEVHAAAKLWFSLVHQKISGV